MFGDDSMPDLTNMCKPDNVARLAAQLEGIATIVVLSVPAIADVKGACIHPNYSHTVHTRSPRRQRNGQCTARSRASLMLRCHYQIADGMD